MAKGKRQTFLGKENTIKCKDCEFHYDPDWTNLSADTQLPILCKCKHSEFLVSYNRIKENCIHSKLKK